MLVDRKQKAVNFKRTHDNAIPYNRAKCKEDFRSYIK